MANTTHQPIFSDDVLSIIVSYCSPNKIVSFTFVSKQFLKVISPKITTVEISKEENAILYLKSNYTRFSITKLKISLGWKSQKMVKLLLKNDKTNNLTYLDLSCNELNDSQVKSIANCSKLKSLTHLNLGCNEFGQKGLISIVKSSKLQQLTHLSVYRNGIPKGFDFSLLNQYLPKLKSLDLSENKFTIEDVNSIFTISHLTSLNLRDLPNVLWCKIEIPTFESLTCLKLGNNFLKDFIPILLRMKNYQSLTELDLGHNDHIHHDEIIDILKRFVNLKKLNLMGTKHWNSIDAFLKVNDKIETFSYLC